MKKRAYFRKIMINLTFIILAAFFTHCRIERESIIKQIITHSSGAKIIVSDD